MRKKWTALAVVLCLLLSGCGGTGGVSSASEASSTPASEQTAVSVAELNETEKAEDSQMAAENGDMTPEELAQWAWTQMEIYNEAAYAIDYDIDVVLAVDLDGESTTQKLSGRVKEIDSETDGEISYESMQMNGAVTETWTGGGYVYLSDSDGKYKAPISDDDSLEDQNSADDLLEIDAGNFGTMTAEKTDGGYTITFGDPTLDTWMAFSDMLSADDDSVNCTAFTLEGTAQMDENGALRKLTMEMSVQFDLLGMTMSETATVNQTINNYDGNVTINVPEDDADFREISDISLPTAFINGFNTLLGQNAVSYETETTITLTDGTNTDELIEDNLMNYIYNEDSGLQMSKITADVLNDELISQSTDTYADGQGTQVINDEEYSYASDDDSILADEQGVIAYYSDCFAYGSDYQMETDGNYQKLTMTLDSVYVEAVNAGYLGIIAEDVNMDEASEVASEGTISFWFDLSGMLVMQQYQGTCVMSFTGAELTLTVVDSGAVLAINDGVTVNAGA